MSVGKQGPVIRAFWRWSYWILGLGSLIWLLLRSGTNPRRLAYPCQRAALLNSAAFLGGPYLGAVHLARRSSSRAALLGVVLLAGIFTAVSAFQQSETYLPSVTLGRSPLPSWTSPEAISDVFAVQSVPVPECSLAQGVLPAGGPCSSPAYALRDRGVEKLASLMEAHGTYFYQTARHPQGIVGPHDVVILKVNNQWGGEGSQDGAGRLATNTDVLKGVIWSILQHPETFRGEIVVAENTQPISRAAWDVLPANAEDQDQSLGDVAAAYQSLGYPVSLYDWTGLNDQHLQGGSIHASGYPEGEYARGNTGDAYILLDDPEGRAAGELSYPKFRTPGGKFVSMRYGIWDGGEYDPDRLTLINLPVLKRHGMAGATVAWKNMIGFITTGDSSSRFGGSASMHDYFFGYAGGPAGEYGLIGRQLAWIKAPDLNIVDAIWVAVESNYEGTASRQDMLLASTDPFAADWYASEYVLLPLTRIQGTSAARGGAFRSATRTNQNAAQLVWPGGETGYPYMDLIDSYDGGAPAEAERNQMNVYVAWVDAQRKSTSR